MEKNWLIRTKSNHILGPVSKEKVLELYSNGSIKSDDELCSGNGYWFFIREDEMVDRFLKGNEIQGFNPISEAKDVLTQSQTSHSLNFSQDENTLIGNVNISQLKKNESHVEKEAATPVRPGPALSQLQTEPLPKKKNKLTLVDKIPSLPREKKVHKSQNFLQYLVIVGFVILFCIVYFRKNLIKAMFSYTETAISSLIASASAQEADQQVKKKSS